MDGGTLFGFGTIGTMFGGLRQDARIREQEIRGSGQKSGQQPKVKPKPRSGSGPRMDGMNGIPHWPLWPLEVNLDIWI
jgi:hypothetical protein